MAALYAELQTILDRMFWPTICFSIMGEKTATDEDELWCNAQRNVVANYLRSQGVEHGRIGDWPAWHVTGCAAIWAIESKARPEWIGWWAISGDLPTDYCSAADIEPPQHPRKAIREIAGRWQSLVSAWQDGLELTDFTIAGPHPKEELAPLLKARAELLLEWAADDALWELE
jgi:hypothetical protein